MESEKAKKNINNSVESTIYFAGEALYKGYSLGTVEAALASGKKTAEKIINDFY